MPQTYLENPIWDKLQQSKECCIIFRDCSETLHTQKLPEVSTCHSCPHEPKGNSPGRSLCRCTAAATCQHRVRHQAHRCRCLAKLQAALEEIQEFTFAHCTSLREISFPPTLHTIRVKAFMNCAALLELAIPPSLKYIGSRAFLDCATLRRVVKLPGRRKWRGVYGEENAFAICPDLKWPPWLHMIPDMGYISGLG